MEFPLYFAIVKKTIYPVIPPLEHIAVLQVAIDLWTRNHIQASIHEHRWEMWTSKTMKEKWEAIELKVMDYAMKLSLPQQLKTKLASFIKPIGEEIFKWKKYHDIKLKVSQDYDDHLPLQLCWTVFGRIDRKKTAQALVRDGKLCFGVRYKLACVYCLESDIVEMWSKVPDEYKKHHSEENPDWRTVWTELVDENKIECRLYNNFTTTRWNELQRLWNRVMEKGGIENFLQHEGHKFPSEFLVQQALYDHNKAAVEYFFPKLTKKTKSEFLETFVQKFTISFLPIDDHFEYFQEIIFFILPLLNESQLTRLLLARNYAVYKILWSCLQFPFQNLFIELADCLWPFFSGYSCSTFSFLLHRIIRKIQSKYEDYDYQELFSKFWQYSPKAEKQYIIDQRGLNNRLLILSLFDVGDKRNIQLIWGCATTKEKERIISCYDRCCCTSYKYYNSMPPNSEAVWKNLLEFLIELSRMERRNQKM